MLRSVGSLGIGDFRARLLLDEALAGYRELGMDTWAARVEAPRRPELR